jgi:hypothetical protein
MFFSGVAEKSSETIPTTEIPELFFAAALDRFHRAKNSLSEYHFKV